MQQISGERLVPVYRTIGPLVSHSEEENSQSKLKIIINSFIHCEIKTLLFEMVLNFDISYY